METFSKQILLLAQAVFVGVGMYKIQELDWLGILVVIQAMFVSALPYLLEYKFQIHTPHLLRISIVLFMFGTLILGEIADFYNTFFWWDVILHGAASAGLALIGFILLVLFYNRSGLHNIAALTSFMALSFALALAVVWEVYEFFVDLLFVVDTPMQPSNFDTMTDLLVSIFGALIVAIGGYRYLRWREKNPIGQIIEEGKRNNVVL